MNDVLCGLAANPALPPELVDRLVARAVAEPGPSEALVEDCAEELLDDLVRALAGRADLGRAHVEALAARDEDTAVLLARDGHLTAADVDPAARPYAALALLDEGRGLPAWARLLAADPSPDIRWKLASCPGLPPDVVTALAADPDVEVVSELALWTTEPPEAARLARHPHPEVRRAAAANPAAPAPAVSALAEDPELSLTWVFAERTDLPQAVHARVAADPRPGVRATLARNPGIGPELIRVLAADPEEDVRRSLAQHPRVPLAVLVGLAATLRTWPALLPRIAAAPPSELEELAASPHAAVRMLVAQRRDLPAHLRDALAEDRDAAVVRAVAPHPGLSEDRLRSMVSLHGVQVLAAVAANPDASGTLLEHLTRHRPPVRKVFKEVARHPNATGPALLACLADRTARPLAAAHPALPAATVTALLTDEDPRVAEEAAANPALPRTVMAGLVPCRPAGPPGRLAGVTRQAPDRAPNRKGRPSPG
ncbi:hypothetical protein PV721_17650 [Streptomyces sp. MB09-01]|uniref:hypothetical protein n=1 Tax=Streptomyces sp. MB09-01 TaxID=3028666 RepID=UPI0029BA5DD8|nr:hypothetical protein [Streptomyces sp. MB09-01]MDX3536165.1 hypothetical protein [Streptomyces sp. MB09-01]